jgi:hypothetical protein
MPSEILYADTFAAGLSHWQLSASGVGATTPGIVNTPGRVWYPPSAVTIGVGNTLSAISMMTTQQYVRQPKAFSVEVIWSLRFATRQFEQWLYYKLPGQPRLTARMKFDTFGKQITVETPSGDVPVASFDDAGFNVGVFVPIKLSVDFSVGRYTRVTIGREVFNVSDRQIPTDTGVGDHQLLTAVMARQVNTASTSDPIVGFVAITADE